MNSKITEFTSLYKKWGLIKGDLIAIDCPQKIDTFFHIIAAVKYGLIPFLYDFNIPLLKKYFVDKNIPHLNDISIRGSVTPYHFISMPDDTFCVLFTSGSTGFPTGLIKTKDNIFNEVELLANFFKSSKSFTATVPFVHIYGMLFGVLLPLHLNADIYINEKFFPGDFLDSVKKYNIDTAVTNPIFINICSKMKLTTSLEDTTFTSSTMPLTDEDANQFSDKFDTHIAQFYGSTETGGIASKMNGNTFWTPFKDINVTVEEERLLVSSPFISPYKIENEILIKLDNPFMTEDYIELQDNCFKLVGRTSNILKVAGKRISTKAMEHLLLQHITSIKDIHISIQNTKGPKSESILITVISDTSIDDQITQIIKANYPMLNIKTKIKYVKNFNTSSSGKKLLI